MKRRAARPVDYRLGAPGLVLDAGALIALEARNIRLLADLTRAHRLGLPIRIPAGCIAQAWRGGPRSASLARLLKQPCTVVQVDERSAKEVGEFLARVRHDGEKADVVDAHVALVARATRSLVWTSDPDDMTRYQVDADFVRTV